MSDQSNPSNNEVTIITGHQLTAHPFYKERSELDKVSGHDWLMLLSLGLTCAMGFRLGAITLQLMNYPAWLVIFFGVVLVSLVVMAMRLKGKMPRVLGAIALTSSLGFVVGFIF